MNRNTVAWLIALALYIAAIAAVFHYLVPETRL